MLELDNCSSWEQSTQCLFREQHLKMYDHFTLKGLICGPFRKDLDFNFKKTTDRLYSIYANDTKTWTIVLWGAFLDLAFHNQACLGSKSWIGLTIFAKGPFRFWENNSVLLLSLRGVSITLFIAWYEPVIIRCMVYKYLYFFSGYKVLWVLREISKIKHGSMITPPRIPRGVMSRAIGHRDRWEVCSRELCCSDFFNAVYPRKSLPGQ